MTSTTELQASWQLAPVWARTIEVIVHGTPVGQGQIRSLGTGRPSIHGNAKVLLPWRDLVTAKLLGAIHFAESFRDWAGKPMPIRFPVGQACKAEAVFTMKKPLAAPKKRRTFPTSAPDVDHLLRAVGDAMTTSGLFRSDAQLVDFRDRKVFPGEDPKALDVPGLRLSGYRLEDS